MRIPSNGIRTPYEDAAKKLAKSKTVRPTKDSDKAQQEYTDVANGTLNHVKKKTKKKKKKNKEATTKDVRTRPKGFYCKA